MSMATGIGTGSLDTNPNRIGDGDASNRFNETDFAGYMAWYVAPSRQEKLDEVFKIPSYPWGPGEVARYRDLDIFMLSAALDSLYRRKEGNDADIWQMMIDEVYRPIGTATSAIQALAPAALKDFMRTLTRSFVSTFVIENRLTRSRA